MKRVGIFSDKHSFSSCKCLIFSCVLCWAIKVLIITVWKKHFTYSNLPFQKLKFVHFCVFFSFTLSSSWQTFDMFSSDLLKILKECHHQKLFVPAGLEITWQGLSAKYFLNVFLIHIYIAIQMCRNYKTWRVSTLWLALKSRRRDKTLLQILLWSWGWILVTQGDFN